MYGGSEDYASLLVPADMATVNRWCCDDVARDEIPLSMRATIRLDNESLVGHRKGARSVSSQLAQWTCFHVNSFRTCKVSRCQCELITT